MAESVIQPANRTPAGLFPKGVSGNPAGRPKRAVLRALLEPHRRTMVATLLQLMRGADKDATRLDAVKTMLAYLEGRPDAFSLDDLSDAEILSIVSKRAERLRAEQGKVA